MLQLVGEASVDACGEKGQHARGVDRGTVVSFTRSALHGVVVVGTVAAWELRCFFQRPSTYVMLLAAALTAGWSFSWLLTLISRGGGVGRPHADDPLVQFLGPNLFLVGLCTWLVPLLTMNLVADERRRGTWELLMTSPAARGQALVGKFLAGWIVFLVTLIPWPYFLAVLRMWNGRTQTLWGFIPWFDGAGVPFDPGPVWSGVVGLATVGSTFVAVGLFSSSLCRRPVSAALLTLLAMLGLLLLGVLPRALEFWEFPRERTAWIQGISCWGHLERFSRGTILPRVVIGHFLVTAGLLWAATRISRRLDDA